MKTPKEPPQPPTRGAGGSYVIDPHTGERTLVASTAPAPIPNPKPEPAESAVVEE